MRISIRKAGSRTATNFSFTNLSLSHLHPPLEHTRQRRVNNPWARERLLEYANELCQMREYRNYHEISENPSSSSTHQTSCDASAFTSNSSFSVESFYSSDFKPPDT
nr:hypothetical transcript [Hymenolepis microstoma]